MSESLSYGMLIFNHIGMPILAGPSNDSAGISTPRGVATVVGSSLIDHHQTRRALDGRLLRNLEIEVVFFHAQFSCDWVRSGLEPTL
jgi:hypothetical protein